jgi:hypothetical protein
MALRLTWSSRSGLRLTETVRVGKRLRLWESIPLTRGKNRRRRTRKGASYRL